MTRQVVQVSASGLESQPLPSSSVESPPGLTQIAEALIDLFCAEFSIPVGDRPTGHTYRTPFAPETELETDWRQYTPDSGLDYSCRSGDELALICHGRMIDGNGWSSRDSGSKV
jgi:hypothetical protein